GTQPGQGIRPGRGRQPAQPGQNTQPAQPGQNTQPAQPGQNTQPAQPGQNTQPAQSGQGAPAGPGSPPPHGAPAAQGVQQAVQSVIQQANTAQVQALTSGDPSVMASTATSDYYKSMVQTNQDLLSSGVSSVQLVNIEWGPVTVQGNTATATT